MGLFDRDPTTKSGLKPKPGPVATEKLQMTRKEFRDLHQANAELVKKAKEKA